MKIRSDWREASRVGWAVAGVVLALVFFRVFRAVWLPDLPNFAPVMAVAICGGLFLPGALAWILPLAALAISDAVLSLVLGYPVMGAGQLVAWVCSLAGVAAGRWLARRPFGWPALLAVVVGGGLVFYLVTNALCWLTMPAYPRGLAGLWQAVTVGLPGFPPSWVFYRNALASDLVFTGLILAVRDLAVSRSGRVAQPV